jgi:hypothetical protein
MGVRQFVSTELLVRFQQLKVEKLRSLIRRDEIIFILEMNHI